MVHYAGAEGTHWHTHLHWMYAWPVMAHSLCWEIIGYTVIPPISICTADARQDGFMNPCCVHQTVLVRAAGCNKTTSRFFDGSVFGINILTIVQSVHPRAQPYEGYIYFVFAYIWALPLFIVCITAALVFCWKFRTRSRTICVLIEYTLKKIQCEHLCNPIDG